MNSCEVIAYTYDGEMVCPDCITEWPAHFSGCGKTANVFDPGWHVGCYEKSSDGAPCRVVLNEGEDSLGVVFAEHFECTVGSTCGDCGNLFGPDGWTEEGAEVFRWARCESCNGVRPFDRGDTLARSEALHNELHCENCPGDMHFE